MARVLDPQALEDYRTIIREQIDFLETELIPMLRPDADLGKMPAFGFLPSSETARSNYEGFHTTTWDNLQMLREALYGMIKTLNDSAELSDEAESENVTDMGEYADLDGGTTGSGDNYVV